jgi:hypothetical protein
MMFVGSAAGSGELQRKSIDNLSAMANVPVWQLASLLLFVCLFECGERCYANGDSGDSGVFFVFGLNKNQENTQKKKKAKLPAAAGAASYVC